MYGNVRDGDIIQKIRLDEPSSGQALYLVTYMSQGLKVRGYLLVPEEANESRKLPGLIYCRGGIRSVGMVKLERIQPFAERGYVVFAPFYRGNEGGEGREDFGGEDRPDVYHAARLLLELPEVQDRLVSVVGFSRGGLMALLAAKECRDVGAVVSWGGVSDLLLTYEERVDLRRMLKRVVGHPKKSREEYVNRSAVEWAEQIRTPVLIVHGEQDEQVGVEHAYRLAKKLEEEGRSYSMAIFADRGHAVLPQHTDAMHDHICGWIEEQFS